MFKNSFRVAWRSIMRNRFYSAINIAGLAIGLAVGIMILLWVQDEFSYDNFHTNAGRIYRVNSHLGTGNDGGIWDGSPGPVAVYSKQSIPEVENAVRIIKIWEEQLFKYENKKFIERDVAFVDASFFSVFDFPFVQGDKNNPFPSINSAVISSSTAKKYFGNATAVGKILATERGDFIVSAVAKDFPSNSTLHFDILLPMPFYAGIFTQDGGNGDWKTIDEDLGNYSFYTFLQLRNGVSQGVVEKKVTQMYLDKRKGEVPGVFFTLQPLKTTHLISANNNASALQTARIFFFASLLILLIACINYVNLSTARAILRSKEVSIRKIVGAPRLQLFMQFITETALVFAFATILSLGIIYLLMPFYNDLSRKNLVFSLGKKEAWIVVGSAVVGTLLMASVYPALLLSSFKPAEALKGKLSFGVKKAGFRKVLVITQFVFSAGLIIGTIIIAKQLDYIKKKDVGYNKEHIFSFMLRGSIVSHAATVRSELLKYPGVIGTASSINSILGASSSTTDTDWPGKETGRSFLINTNFIDENFLPLMQIPLVAGRNFYGSGTDSANFILNETAIKQAGIKDPIGKTFSLWSKTGTIIGVMKDFNYESLHSKINPTIFKYRQGNELVYVRAKGENMTGALSAARSVWKKYGTEYPFSYSFLNDDFHKLYLADQRTGTLFNVFAFVAIIISCLGLFGLATYTAQVKIKEIGIRKVLGASVASITRLLAKDFILLVFIAFIIAAPITWFLVHKWLQNYAYRIEINWWIFIVTGILILTIALVTVSFQAIKAALANPVTTLRDE